jgi:hypothetical protein
MNLTLDNLQQELAQSGLSPVGHNSSSLLPDELSDDIAELQAQLRASRLHTAQLLDANAALSQENQDLLEQSAAPPDFNHLQSQISFLQSELSAFRRASASTSGTSLLVDTTVVDRLSLSMDKVAKVVTKSSATEVLAASKKFDGTDLPRLLAAKVFLVPYWANNGTQSGPEFFLTGTHPALAKILGHRSDGLPLLAHYRDKNSSFLLDLDTAIDRLSLGLALPDLVKIVVASLPAPRLSGYDDFCSLLAAVHAVSTTAA